MGPQWPQALRHWPGFPTGDRAWAKLVLDDGERVLCTDEMRAVLRGGDWGRVLAGIAGVQLAVELSEGSGFDLSVRVSAAKGEPGIIVTYPVGGLGSDETEDYTHAWTEDDLHEYGDDLDKGHRWCVVVPSSWQQAI